MAIIILISIPHGEKIILTNILQPYTAQLQFTEEII